jgi:4-hydroxybenzoate polyprenyltransferase/phosphoserine phosphatase
MHPPAPSPAPVACPLYVDMDGTLLGTDTLHESVWALLRRRPWAWLQLWFWLWLGKAGFKRRVADQVQLEVADLPQHQAFVEWLRQQRAAGRRLVLATAADTRLARAVADHVGLFDAVLATGDAHTPGNLSRERKRAAIEQHLHASGAQAYAYAGNSADDLPVWAGAAEAVVVQAPERIWRQVQRQHPHALRFQQPGTSVRDLLKAIRISQWAKNALLFVPLLAAHQTDLVAWTQAAWAFLAFGLCASATYLVNDLLDLPNDRRHPHKRHRPLAAGRLSLRHGSVLLVLMLPLAWAIAWGVGSGFFASLVLYTLVTLAYSLRLKRVALLDVLVLSGLYTLRLVAGAAATGVELSNWLLAISLFLFLGLALVKRCAELEEVLLDSAVDSARGRGYHQNDLPTLRVMGVSSAFLTVMVLALYIDSQNGRELYAQPDWLWGVIPLLLWWMMRIWFKTGRRELHGEDPLQFALHDRFSWATLAGIGLLGGLATWGP